MHRLTHLTRYDKTEQPRRLFYGRKLSTHRTHLLYNDFTRHSGNDIEMSIIETAECRHQRVGNYNQCIDYRASSHKGHTTGGNKCTH